MDEAEIRLKKICGFAVEIATIKIIMEIGNKKIGVSQKAIIIGKDGKILTIRRTETAPSRPLNWDLPGGDLDFGEDPRDGIQREIKEETGLEIRDLSLMDVLSELYGGGEFWVTICYKAMAETQDVVLSYEHDEFRWVTPDEFKELKASPKNRKFIDTFEFLRLKK